MTAHHPHSPHIAMFVNDRFNDHDSGEAGHLGKRWIFQFRGKQQARRLHFAAYAERLLRPCRYW